MGDEGREILDSYIEVEGRRIGSKYPVYIVAEIGINHNGNLETAKELIRMAANAGIDAVKLQTFKVDSFVAPGNPYYELLKHSELANIGQLRELQTLATELGVTFFSSSTEPGGLRILNELNIPLNKISSANITNLPLIRQVARTKKPVIISTGASYLSEIDEAIRTLLDNGANQIIILKCTALYPCLPEDVNLNAMCTLKTTFGLPVGYSDHTTGIEAVLAAVALGACVIEKHITLSKESEGPDHHFSADQKELRELVYGIRIVEKMLGDAQLGPVEAEKEFQRIARRYITATKDIMKGNIIKLGMIAIRKPSVEKGIAPKHLDMVLGRMAKRDILAGENICWEAI